MSASLRVLYQTHLQNEHAFNQLARPKKRAEKCFFFFFLTSKIHTSTAGSDILEIELLTFVLAAKSQTHLAAEHLISPSDLCVILSLGHTNLLCADSILVHVMQKQTQCF